MWSEISAQAYLLFHFFVDPARSFYVFVKGQQSLAKWMIRNSPIPDAFNAVFQRILDDGTIDRWLLKITKIAEKAEVKSTLLDENFKAC